MATEPTILLLDEPTAGMNPRETLELRDHIVRMRDEVGLTVLVIEHDMRVVKGVSDRVVACDYGQKIGEGTYEEVANDEQVIEAYLGTKAVGMSDERRAPARSSSCGTSAPTTAWWRCSATSTSRSTRARWSACWAATPAARPPR